METTKENDTKKINRNDTKNLDKIWIMCRKNHREIDKNTFYEFNLVTIDHHEFYCILKESILFRELSGFNGVPITKKIAI